MKFNKNTKRENGVVRESDQTAAQGGNPHIKWFAIGAVILIFLVGLILFRRNQAAKLAESKPDAATLAASKVQLVNVMPVTTGNIARTLTVTGTLKSGQDVDLSSKVSGRVETVAVQEGQRVRRGQLLVAIEDEDLRAQVAQARAGLSTAQVRLRQQQVGLPARVADINTTIEKARTALDSARARYQQARLQEPAKVQEVAAAVEQAQAGLETAQAQLAQAKAQEPASIQAAEAQLNDARQTAKSADARLAQARTTAKQTQEQVEADIAAATAGLEQSRASLAEVIRGSREQQIAQAESQVREAQVNLDNAKTELDRAEFLFRGDAGTKSAVDTAQTQYNLAKTRLVSAQENLSLVREGATTEQIQQAEQAVRQAQAQLTNARAGRARITNAQSEITAALAAQTQARQAITTAQANLASQEPTARQNTRIARERVDQARAQLLQARSRQAEVPVTRQATRIALQDVNQAQAALNQAIANRANIPVAREDVAAAQAGVESARAQLDQALLNLKNARIYAPVDGIVNKKLVGPGQTVSPATPLINLVALNSVYFEAQVSESDVRNVEEGDRVRVNVPAVSDKTLSGFVSDINPVADPQSRQFRLRVTIPSAPRQLTPGAFARGEVVTQAVYNTLVVPDEAIQKEDGKTTVLVAEGDGEQQMAQRATVVTGLSSNGKTQIRGGLQKGEQVIIGNPLLKDGDKIRVAQSAATSSENSDVTVSVAGE
jgi:RND family efflux transporter MFP subunit